jgi:serine/threonine protein kinase
LLSKVQHPNVVKCFGACLKPPKLCFVMEFMPQSLANYIEKCKEAMPLKDLVTIAYYIALGIDFLHECKIIHRDLKPENILVRWSDYVCTTFVVNVMQLDDDLTPKIADFGVSREKVQTAVMTKVGTVSHTNYA